MRSSKSELRKSKNLELSQQAETEWRPKLVDYISLNDQISADVRSINTRFKTISNKLSDVSYTNQNPKETKKYRPSHNLSKIHANSFTAVL